jgi:hypothetical protein
MKSKQREWVGANPNLDVSDAPGTYALSRGDFFGMPQSWREECRKALAS